jgi:hypothetical protein
MSQADNLAALGSNVNTSGVLQPASGGTGVTTSTGTGSVVLSSGATLTNATINGAVASGFTMKNRIINGQFQIDQYNVGASSNTASGAGQYYIDRWFFYYAQTAKIASLGQNLNSVGAPAGHSSYYGLQTAASTYSPVAADYFDFGQVFEYNNVADFNWGTANAKAVAVSFWVRSSQTGTFGGSIYNYNQTYGYAFTYTVSAANTWQYITISIPGPTAGAWNSGNAASFILNLFPTTGSNYQQTAGSWVAANVHGATGAINLFGVANSTFYITGVQLETGSTATSFEWRPYTTELQLCQRYYQCVGGAFNGSVSYQYYSMGFLSTGATNFIGNMIFPVTMRTSPSFTAINPTKFIVFASGGAQLCTSVNLDISSPTNVGLYTVHPAGLVQYQGARLLQDAANTTQMQFSAEL